MSVHTSFSETFLGLDVLLDIPVQLVLSLMVLFVLLLTNSLHLLVIVEMVPIVCRLLLS